MELRLISTGSCLPNQQIFNKDLTQFHPSTLGLISAKTGVESRYRAEENHATSDLAIAAGLECLRKGRILPQHIDAVIVATSTPDRLIPATATKVAAALGAKNAFGFDMNSVCSSSIYILEVAKGLILSGAAKNVLAIAADTYSKFLNPDDFTTFPYFGDGAGAVLLSASDNGMGKLTQSILHSDGDGYEVVTIKGGGSELSSSRISDKRDGFFKMNGRAVFEFATRVAKDTIEELFVKCAIEPAQVSKIILHQANINIVKKVAADLALSDDLFFTNLQRCGNTAGASVLIALDEYLASEAFVNSGHIVLCSFGGGLSWGATAIELN